MIARLHADEAGETHLADFELPIAQRSDDGRVRMRGLTGVPTGRLGIHDVLEKAPAADFHSTSPRKLIAVLRGTFEITASDGERRRFGPGDVLLTDDLNSKGHAFRDVGAETLLTIIAEIDDDWSYPGVRA
jgi:quercetin dioxygenase-like cupin family protein